MTPSRLLSSPSPFDGGGAAVGVTPSAGLGSAAPYPETPLSPPSPALPPSRGEGEAFR